MKRLGMEEGVPIESRMVTPRHRAGAEAGRAAQLRDPQAPARVRRRQQQAAHRDLRAAPRAARRQGAEGVRPGARATRSSTSWSRTTSANRKDRGEWDLEAFRQQLLHFFGYDPERGRDLAGRPGAAGRRPAHLGAAGRRATRPRRRRSEPSMMRHYERHILLQIIDAAWKDHLLAMDHLKDGIGLRAYGQQRPAGRVQARVLRHVLADEGADRERRRPLPVPAGAR